MTTPAISEPRSRILIIDDDAYFITMVKNALGDICDIQSSTKASEGLQMAAEHPLPDLILLDIMMPGTSGYQVCRELKQSPVTFGIPVIFVSAMDKPSERVRCFELGGVDFVAKPVEMTELEARIKNHLILKLQREMLFNLSSSDSLTGLVNKRSFEELLATEWGRAERRNQSISLIVCDLDFFKTYSQQRSTEQSDACIKRVSKIIFDTACRAGDTVARIDNDKFAVVLPDCDSVGCLSVAQRLKSAVLDEQIQHPDSEVSNFMTMSIGVAYAVPDDSNSVTLFSEQAKRSLEIAKQNGRNRVGVAV